MFGITNYYGDPLHAPNASNPFGNNLPGYNLEIPNTTTLPLATTALNGGNGFLDPHLPLATDAASAPPASGAANANGISWVVTPPLGVNSARYVGLRMPDFQLDLTKTSNPNSNGAFAIHYSFGSPSAAPFGAALEFQNPLGEWVPYTYSMGLNEPSQTWMTSAFQNGASLLAQSVPPAVSGAPYKIKTLPALAGAATSLWPALAVSPMYMTCDPRSLRFGQWQFDKGDKSPYPTASGEDSRLWSDTTPALFQTSGYGSVSNPVQVTQMQFDPINFGSCYFPATLSRNNTANYSSSNAAPYSSYPDRDGVRRIGDSGLYPQTQDYSAGNPYYRSADRPILLNRAFHNVAELGFAFRDDPWRSLDFFSGVSADAGLLDLFTINDGSADMVSGRISLNSQNSAALSAVINGTMADVISGTTTVAAPNTIASSLVTFTATSPLVNKAELASRIAPYLAAPGTGVTSNFGSLSEQNIKSRREAFVRALGDVGQTRTWNLMIDIVAQAGKYPLGATGLDQFVVDGEHRYWLHVAIDRFTGQVIDQKLEPVTE
jgi:hypothetical protein